MKKIVLIFGFVVLALCGCGQKAPGEDQVKEDLPWEIQEIIIKDPIYSEVVVNFEIEDIEVERQLTEGKTSTVYCKVDLTSEFYHSEEYVTLYYTKYDNGNWIVDNWEYYQPSIFEVTKCPFSKEDIEYYLYSDYDEVYVEEPVEITSTELYYPFVAYNYNKYTEFTINGSYNISFDSMSMSWTCYSDTIEDKNWNITGEWGLVESTLEIPLGAVNRNSIEFNLNIESFDNESYTAEGELSYYYKSGMGIDTYSETLDLSDASIYEFDDPDLKGLHITCGDIAITIYDNTAGARCGMALVCSWEADIEQY